MKRYSTSDRLKQIMKKDNLRQVDILDKSRPYCEKFGIRLGRNDLSQYVSGKVEPGQEKLTILAKALNVSESWLMGLDVPMREDETVSKIINARAKEIGITLKQVAEKAEVPLKWLQTIETFIPGDMEFMIDDVSSHEIGWNDEIDWPTSYKWITKVADAIGLPGSLLRTALARQEIPIPTDMPVITAKEAFQETNSFTLTSAESEHINKYRTIDNQGKHTVDTVLDMEYNRCKNKQ